VAHRQTPKRSTTTTGSGPRTVVAKQSVFSNCIEAVLGLQREDANGWIMGAGLRYEVLHHSPRTIWNTMANIYFLINLELVYMYRLAEGCEVIINVVCGLS